MQTLETLAGRYDLVRLLGAGAMGEVWLAEDRRSRRQVALKILEVGDAAEASALESLSHPGIVEILDHGTANGHHYLAMEYVEAETLRDVLQAGGRLPEETAIEYGVQVAGALEHAHARGVVHRDLKPENLLITPAGQVKLADFGIARKMVATLTPEEARELVGTLGYLAPEVVEGGPAGVRSDIYSLAAIVYEMVAGRLPHSGTGAAALATRLTTEAPLLRAFARTASPELERVLARGLASSPMDRQESAGEFGAQLAAVGRRKAKKDGIAAVVPPTRMVGPTALPRGRSATRVAPAGRRRFAPGVLPAVALIGLGLMATGALALFAGTGRDGGEDEVAPNPTTAVAATATAPPPPTGGDDNRGQGNAGRDANQGRGRDNSDKKDKEDDKDD